MLNRHALITALTFTLTDFALTACGGGGASPNLAPQAQASSSLISNVSRPGLSGQYAGTVNDSLFGSGLIYAQLVQYRNAVGGNFTFRYGSTEFGTPHVFLSKGTTLTGAGESATVSLDPCTVSETATHSNHSLNGSYKAVRGCSGGNGAFTMQEHCRYVTNSFALAGSALKACGGADDSPSLASQPQAAPSLISNDASTPNLSGEYAGTVNDSLYGSGQVDAELVQYQNAVGGSMILEFGSTAFINPNVFLLKGTTLTGIAEGATFSGVPCAISETATHSNRSLNGSYKAVTGCSGESGTFTMKAVCRFVTNSIAEPKFALKYCYSF